MTDSAVKDVQNTAQSRFCFVIIPFSTTGSCTEDQWTLIFETVLKPAVEGAGLNYVCRRSTATRGNLIAAILESLRDAYVVLADLTDQNPNVFYELGVRHALKDRTILIAQDRKFIPFDLRPYASHVYRWKTKKGRQELANKLRELLADIDQSPDRPDNPVSDFLRARAVAQEAPALPVAHSPPTGVKRTRVKGAPAGPALAGPESKGVDALRLGRELGKTKDIVAIRTIVRLTRSFFIDEWPSRIEDLNSREPEATVTESEVYEHCLPYVNKFSTDIELVEAFGLALTDAEYDDGLTEVSRIAQDWISLSDRIWPGRSVKPARGAPGLLALRVLANWGAKSADNASLDTLRVILTHPLETVEATGQPATLPLVERRDMFHPDALLDRADLAVRYIVDASWENDSLRKMFVNNQDYLDGLSRFFFLAALTYDARHPDDAWPLYPGFKLIPGSSRFAAKLSASGELVASVAKMAGEEVGTFRSKWPGRVRRLNEARLGGRRDLFAVWERIPEEL